MKKFFFQVGLLLLAYYFAPGLIQDFLKDANPQVSYYTVLFIKVALVILIIVSSLTMRIKLEKSIVEFLKDQIKLKQADELLKKFANLLVQIVFILLIVTISIPLLKYFLGTQLITIIKLAVLAYCIFLGYGIYKLFDVEEKTSEPTE
jgi:hypothetical protein